MEFYIDLHPVFSQQQLKQNHMQQKTLFSVLAIAGIAAILTLSSFFRPDMSDHQITNDEDTVGYRSNAKEIKRKGPLTLSASFENDYYTRQSRTGHYYVEVQAGKKNNEYAQHVPLNLSVVIDRSGSMSGEKIRNAKKAAKYIVDQMNPEDYLSVVIYDQEINVIQPAGHVYNKQLLKNKIDQIVDRGSTNLMGGALKGYAEVAKNYQSSSINRVLLLSDGLANEGITNPNEIERIVRQKNREEGISISTFGVGNDYNEDLMTAMAENGTGNYYFIDQPEKISGIFSKELNGLMEVVAQNAVLKITLPDFVNVEKVHGYKHEQTGRVLTIRFHDIFSEETKGVLIRYTVNRDINNPVSFNTTLNYSEPGEDVKQILNVRNQCEFTTNNYTYREHFSEWVAAQVALYEVNESLENAMKEVDNGNYEKARQIVKDNNEQMVKKAKLVERSPELQRAQQSNAVYDTKIESVETMDEESRKYMQKSTKSENYQIRTKKR
ncbi:MAG: VWA domain-containing protein [Chitinophagaceae bacterium]|nr:VWA domain-containing protein [Chitinophagaceae bacterium]